MKTLNLSRILVQLISFSVVLIIAFLFLFKGCDDDHAVVFNQQEYKDSIQRVLDLKFQLRSDSLNLVKKKDSVRVEKIVEYRYLKGRIDTVPCEQLLPKIVNVCDSIILIDSSEISTLKNIVKLDSAMFVDYKRIIKSDSIEIVSLNKKVKKQKRRLIASAAGGSLFAIIAIFK